MNSDNIKISPSAEIEAIRTDLASRRIYAALSHAERLADSKPEFKPLAQEAARLRETYSLLAGYAMAGLPDPSRPEMLREIADGVATIATSAERIAGSADNPSLYYATLRFRATRPADTPAAAARSLLDRASKLSMAAFTGSDSIALRRETESAERDWFRTIWTTFPLSKTDAEAIDSVIDSEVTSPAQKAMTLGAVMLGALAFFDRRRIELLVRAAMRTADRSLAMRATLYTAIALAMTPDRSRLEPLRHLFDSLAENSTLKADLRAIFTQLLRARDTERISRKMTDEILPSMKNIEKDLKDIASRINPESPESIEDIPEWAELAENSELAATMREMNEIHQQGGDIMMTTFGNLKNYPFFNEISNWFIPFDSSRSEIAEALESFGPLAEMLGTAGMLCDNDRYSVALAMAGMPSSQRGFLASQLNTGSEQLARMQADMLEADTDADRTLLATNHVRSLYRFFKLFNRRTEFADPFLTPLNLLNIDLLRPAFDHGELTREAADFFFSHGYWEDALPLLLDACDTMKTGEEATTYFRTGVVLAALDRHEEALSYFEKSELFDDSSADLKLKMAVTLRRLGNHRRAAEYFSQVSESRGGDDKIDLFTAASLAATDRHEDARRMLLRIDYNRGLAIPFVRLLAECEFHTGEFDKCRATLGRIEKPRAADIAMLASMACSDGNYTEAAHLLGSARQPSEAVAEFERNRQWLSRRGVDTEVVDIIIDSALEQRR